MADEKQTAESRYRDQIGEENRFEDADYTEETAAEIAAPAPISRDWDYEEQRDEETASGQGYGLSALALSIISLFVLPILFGAAGIILGFIARRRGAESLGSWAIGIGAVSIIFGIFIRPFF
ncbi:hypothetical protein C0971_12530 [Bacillus methanolicus]|uniref:YybS family protein n=1 Tax=Bacillus methanolicus TaxID=1471 RepID=UPI00200E6194|nr:YybS family protein [Bacillus methanolicus]UQD52768.1 hypothetical protein C0971_12530 [Bacillus methanolicus]